MAAALGSNDKNTHQPASVATKMRKEARGYYQRHLLVSLGQAFIVMALSLYASQAVANNKHRPVHQQQQHSSSMFASFDEPQFFYVDHLMATTSTKSLTTNLSSTAAATIKPQPPPRPESPAAKPEQEATATEQKDHHPSLQIAWLMSFPNSGTSYTLHLIQTLTHTQTATNYASMRLKRLLAKTKSANNTATGSNATATMTSIESRPVFADQPMGPFWSYSGGDGPTTTRALPSNYVLTKTHCGPPCQWCPMQDYIKTMSYFRSRCALAERVVTNSTAGSTEKALYPLTRVAKSVHLMRDPFDNVVSRFRYERSNHRSAVQYPATRDGFRAYCRALNRAFDQNHKTSKFLDRSSSALRRLQQVVPCYADFLRYIEWHNMAFVTEWDLGTESMVLHYEDYQPTSFNDTAQRLLDFLELSSAHAAAGTGIATFDPSKTYRHQYFSKAEQAVALDAMHRLALQSTRQHLRRYSMEADEADR